MTKNVITLPVNPCLPVNHEKMLAKHAPHNGNKFVKCEHCDTWWKASATFSLGWVKIRWYHFRSKELIKEQLAEMRRAETRAFIAECQQILDAYELKVKRMEMQRLSRIGKSYPYAEDSRRSEDRLVKHLKNNRW